MQRIITHLGLALSLLLVVACTPPYTMTQPKTFKRFEESRDFRMITADGVMLKARQVDNYPEATLEFWTDAMGRHMEAQGYVLKSKDCFKTAKGKNGCTIDLVLPHGAEDWVLSETLFVVDDQIVIVEAAGPFDRFALIEKDLETAMKTFEPNL
ncbi:MAG: hypothetical protein GY854_15085 [Deltaproteobacteria bacterium]|nr:hypothetical protein [Deltaproteobacteria bacterium]